MPQELNGKAAIVTGAARGIGRAIAERFVEAGAAVCIADRDGPGAQRVARELGDAAVAAEVDISDRAQVEDLVDLVVGRLGRLDILVNNAAHARYDFAATSPTRTGTTPSASRSPAPSPARSVPRGR